jgi:hypothetical protein
MDDSFRKNLTGGINPFADDSLSFDEQLRRKAQQLGIEPSDSMVSEVIEEKAKEQFPGEEAPVEPQPIKQMADQQPDEQDLLQKQEQALKESTPEDKQPVSEVAAPQDDVSLKTDPIAYLRNKYGLAAPTQVEEMKKDTDYSTLKDTQRRGSILNALSEFDKSAGQLGSSALLEGRKAGYTGSYTGGALKSVADREAKDLEERKKFRDEDLKNIQTGLTVESAADTFKNKLIEAEKKLEDEKELAKMEGPLYEMTKDLYKTAFGKDLPEGISPKVLFKVQPEFKDVIKQRMVNEATAEQSRLNRENQLELKEMEVGKKDQTAQDKATLEMGKEQLKQLKEIRQGELSTDNQLTQLNDTINQYVDYVQKSKFGGTGPIANMLGLKSVVDTPTQKIKQRFNQIALDKLVQQFSGMSKAIDSNAERAFFESTQPGTDKDEDVNFQVLFGMKSVMLKDKAEKEAQRRWIQSGKDMVDYESPIVGKTATVVDTTGKMHIIPKGQLPDALKNGYTTVDGYVDRVVKKKRL